MRKQASHLQEQHLELNRMNLFNSSVSMISETSCQHKAWDTHRSRKTTQEIPQ
jgi:hypothetical protein